VKKEITIEECLLPINATLFGVNFDPPHQMVHACECGDDTDISVSEELLFARERTEGWTVWGNEVEANAEAQTRRVAT